MREGGIFRRPASAALAALLLAGCAGPRIDRSYSAKLQGSRAEYLILHYTVGDFPSSLKTLTGDGVSVHYLVDDATGNIYGLVDETRRASHAGVSSWKGHTFLNSASIGIEIVNPGFRDTAQGRTWYGYPAKQIDSVVELVRDIVRRNGIPPERVLGHSDIAPQRKSDPGPLFPWKRLADEGLALWPDPAAVAQRLPVFAARMPDVAWFQGRLAAFGYATPQGGTLDEETRNVVRAFQMRFRPAKFDGEPDAETAAMLDVLTAPPGLPPMPMPAAVTPGMTPATMPADAAEPADSASIPR